SSASSARSSVPSSSTTWFHAVELEDRKSTRLNSSHVAISYAVFCLKKKICVNLRNLWFLPPPQVGEPSGTHSRIARPSGLTSIQLFVRFRSFAYNKMLAAETQLIST